MVLQSVSKSLFPYFVVTNAVDGVNDVKASAVARKEYLMTYVAQIVLFYSTPFSGEECTNSSS
jgi:hypothetical protein